MTNSKDGHTILNRFTKPAENEIVEEAEVTSRAQLVVTPSFFADIRAARTVTPLAGYIPPLSPGRAATLPPVPESLARRKRTDEPYSGEFASFIPSDMPYDEYFDLRHARLDQLFDHEGIERGDWCALAMQLAFRHVPGLKKRPKKLRGQPSKRLETHAFFICVKALVDAGIAQEKAFAELCAEPSSPWMGKKVETLRRRYFEMVKRSARLGELSHEPRRLPQSLREPVLKILERNGL